MKIGSELQRLRKEKGLSQEQLADYLGVSRQSVSKWEQDLAYPETEKLIKLSSYYNVSIDSLLNPNNTYKKKNTKIVYIEKQQHYEYKSKKTIFGLPLVHINVGKGLYVSKGIISIGNISLGVISLGLSSLGLFSIGVASLGLISIGVIVIGLLLALGSIAVGIIAVGSIAVGIYSIGALSIGYFSIGANSIAKYIAIGDYASGLIAIGKTKANGTYTFIENYDKDEVISIIDSKVPQVWKVFINWIKSNL